MSCERVGISDRFAGEVLFYSCNPDRISSALCWVRSAAVTQLRS